MDERAQAWRKEGLRALAADGHRSGDTNLLRLWCPATPGLSVYLKDESNHKTGSLKHRLGRSLYEHALANGLLRPDSVVFEASSGNTAVAEAFFAQLLGLRFVAVM